MTYLTRKNDTVFRANYEKNFAHVDNVSHVFGVVSHQKWYWECDGWCTFIDTLVPELPIIGKLDDLLIKIVQYCYNGRAEHCYNTGVDQGRAIMGELSKAIDDYTAKINDGINRLNRVKSDAEKWLNNHEKRLKDLEKQMGLPVNIFDIFKGEK